MEEIKKAQEVYKSIKIPSKLESCVKEAISNKTKKYYSFRGLKYAMSTVACTFVAFIFFVNVNPSFAQQMYDIPVIGDIAKVFTVKEYHENDDLKLINAKIPAIQNTGNTDLEQRINYEIMTKMNDVLKEAEDRAAEYKDAFIATGGEEKDYVPVNIQVDYEIKYSVDDIISFVIYKSETLASAYTETFFYNIDIETGKNLNLKDLLGENYKDIVNEAIYNEIEERSKDSDNSYFTADEGGFAGITDEFQDFYINSAGKIVIVFPKYAIAPGYMGVQEFEIDEQIF